MIVPSKIEPHAELEEAAEQAEQYKRWAIARLREKLGDDQFERAMCELIDADAKALEERGR